MPCLFTMEQKQCREDVSTDVWHFFAAIKAWFITMDETSSSLYSERIVKTMDWNPILPAPKKVNTGIIWGIIFIDYFQKCKPHQRHIILYELFTRFKWWNQEKMAPKLCYGSSIVECHLVGCERNRFPLVAFFLVFVFV